MPLIISRSSPGSLGAQSDSIKSDSGKSDGGSVESTKKSTEVVSIVKNNDTTEWVQLLSF